MYENMKTVLNNDLKTLFIALVQYSQLSLNIHESIQRFPNGIERAHTIQSWN